MPSEIVKQHYIALAKLLIIYHSGPLDKDLLKASHHFCKNLYAAAKTHPDLIFAQPQLYKSQLPFVVNLAFNSVVFTCLLAIRNKFDPSVTIQLMCGSMSIYALEQSSIEKHYQIDEKNEDNEKSAAKNIGYTNSKFTQLLKTNQHHIWLSSYLLCSHIHVTRYPRTSLTDPTSALTYMANKFALLCILNKRKQAISFANAIKHLSIKCCPKWYAMLIPLLEYPSVLPVGSYIRLQDGSIHIILLQSIEGLVTKPLPNKESVVVQSDKADIQLTLAEQVIQHYPCQQLNSFTRLSQWWGTDLMVYLASKSSHQQIAAFHSVKPIQPAPASLLVIQDQLNHINADMAAIVKAIEKEPSYAHQLQVSASVSNRKKQSVQSIQQALAMLGFERTNSILLQQSLLSGLNQHYFPLQQALLTFSQFFVLIVDKLAAKTKLVSPELASTTACFVVSRLFTLPKMRTMCHWEISTRPTYKVTSLVELKEAESLKSGAFLLANAWQQNKQILNALQHYDIVMQNQTGTPSARQLCFLLGLSLSLAQEHYFSDTTRCKETTSYFKAGLLELNISQVELMDMMTEIVSIFNISCPLQQTY
jgi:HD-like signal output (HDOD) protein